MYGHYFVLAFFLAVLLRDTALKATDASSSENRPSPKKYKSVASTSQSHQQQQNPGISQLIPPHQDKNAAFQRMFQRLNEKIEKAKIESEKRKEAGKLRKTDLDLEQSFKHLKISKD
ncbi:uncharacterized protein FA14DRAFT_152321 [Meira miltonrushii]|uniref:Uncharacterized protein n=1 Tax=Meira miltonrushii TaxID=1280837 RepID=A0A316VIL9_9BASI|nr:uncharacterized protein FA14DRAFT_152321 [Meira miltonrushii]PWN36898.1 hypothetical protein FA14DRAFT_152321 [Meira miltonrushii]